MSSRAQKLAHTFRLVCSVFMVSLIAALFATAANAQDIDWLVNVDETGTPAPAGGLIDIPVTVTNNGFDDADATTIDIVVPVDTTFETFSGTIVNCAPLPARGGSTVTCDVPALPSSATAEVLFGLRTTVAGSPSMSATVPLISATGQVDINTANNTQSKTLTFTAGADIELTVDAPLTAASGEIVDIRIRGRTTGDLGQCP